MTATAFGKSLDLLPAPLRERALALRPYLTGNRRDPGVARWTGLAFDAAYAGDEAAAAQCLEQAAARAAMRDAASAQAREHEDAQAAARRQQREEKQAALAAAMPALLRDGLSGKVPAPPAAGAVIAASDGSWKGSYGGWAYLSDDGHWALGAGRMSGQAAPPGGHRSRIAELRAAAMAVSALPGPVTVYLDSDDALRYLAAWQAGGDRVPDRLDRPDLSRIVRERGAELAFRHVHGHRGHLLNEAADSLAKMARMRRSGKTGYTREELEARAADLVRAFLASWRQAAP